jgi:hypothetical protein
MKEKHSINNMKMATLTQQILRLAHRRTAPLHEHYKMLIFAAENTRTTGDA